VQTVGKREPMDGDLGRFYDAIENPRKTRNELPILRGDDLRSYMRDVRERTLDVLGQVDLSPDGADPVLRDGFVYELILAHEYQHNETMLQLLQMVESYDPGEGTGRNDAISEELPTEAPEMVRCDGGEVTIGDGGEGFAYDNERPLHTIELAPFELDRAPVSNGQFANFIEETGAEVPLYWERDGEGGWIDTAMGERHDIDPERVVVHVDYEQAEGFAEWAGKRLPTEFEWEAAAAGSDSARANLDHLAYGTTSSGAYGDAPSHVGAVQMLGDVWEWTSSDFLAYPGFEAFPYEEYSKVFFGPEHKVLRGGAWATRTRTIRTSFRNWDLPERRQIFSGIRCARDA
jgi:iron(II)-dependent oxidoreductase